MYKSLKSQTIGLCAANGIFQIYFNFNKNFELLISKCHPFFYTTVVNSDRQVLRRNRKNRIKHTAKSSPKSSTYLFLSIFSVIFTVIIALIYLISASYPYFKALSLV